MRSAFLVELDISQALSSSTSANLKGRLGLPPYSSEEPETPDNQIIQYGVSFLLQLLLMHNTSSLLLQLRKVKANHGYTIRRWGFVNRENRVPHYQELFQRHDGVRQWSKVGETSFRCSKKYPSRQYVAMESQKWNMDYVSKRNISVTKDIFMLDLKVADKLL